MLIQQLHDLEGNGVVIRKVYPEAPPKVEYALTEEGLALRRWLHFSCGQCHGREIAFESAKDAPPQPPTRASSCVARELGNPLCTQALIISVSIPLETARLEFCGVINIDHIAHRDGSAL